jgi:CDP-diacylglycerol--glycerol-3-phosphate 3-phosphatidyltransferase
MSERVASLPYARIPNGLTLFRIALIPLFVFLLVRAEHGTSVAAAVVFAVAGITDQLDGWLARRWHVESRFGQLADPLADRLMIDSAVILLWHADRLPLAALVVILGRDLLLIGGYRFAADRGYDFSVSLLGKSATWILYAAIALVLLVEPQTHWPLYLVWTGLALAVAAGLLYVWRALNVVVRK